MLNPKSHNPSDSLKIACFSDTYGVQANNGVGRFLENLKNFDHGPDRKIRIFAPGKSEKSFGVDFVRAPSFPLPVYSKVVLSMPLEQHRRRIKRQLAEWQPDAIHVSTPGPFGFFGLSLGLEMKLPIVGIYHTDFPKYAAELTRKHAQELQKSPLNALGPFAPQLFTYISPILGKLTEGNPQLAEDGRRIVDIATRNYKALNPNTDPVELVTSWAERITKNALRLFYSRFSMVIGRSSVNFPSCGKNFRLTPTS